jgi:hypothetical protein
MNIDHLSDGCKSMKSFSNNDKYVIEKVIWK